MVGSGPRRVEQEGADGRHDRGGAEVVDRVVAAYDGDLERDRGDHERGEADRDVDEEDPAPAGTVGEEATQHGTQHAGRAEDRTEVAAVTATLTRRDDVADGGQGEGEQTTATEALDGTEGDQLADVLSQAGHQGADQEGDDRGLEDQLATVEVGDLAPQRRRGGLGEQVGRDHPGQVAEAAELAGDAGECGTDDGLVEGGEEHARHQPAHHHQDLAVAEIALLVGSLGLRHEVWVLS